MTDTPPRPKRRRWRWLTVGVSVVAAFAWLGGDHREHPVKMVGRWQHSKNPGYRKQPLPDLELRADGTGEFMSARGGSPMTWWADGPMVVLQHDPRSPGEWLQFMLSEAYSRIRSTHWRRPQLRLYVTSITPERMSFSQIGSTESTRDSSDPEELFIRIEE